MYIENPNKKYHTIVIVLLTIGILTILSFVNTGFKLFGVKFRDVNILSELTEKSTHPTDTLSPDIIHLLKDTVEKINLDSIKKIDSIRKAMRADTMINDYSPDSLHSLGRFFKALYHVKNAGKKARIAHFGDSMIEGDLISQHLRNILQAIFGGSGVGFVPITSVVAGYRGTIKHEFSDNWQSFSILQPEDTINYGISGYTFRPNYKPAEYKYDTVINESDTLIKSTKIFQPQIEDEELSWVSYETPEGSFSNLRIFRNFDLYYGPCTQNSQIKYSIDEGEEKTMRLTGKRIVNRFNILDNAEANKVKITFKTDSIWDVYGVSSESNSGLILDNFAVRGNSGLGLTAISASNYRQFNQYMNYDLVILQFGLNVSDASTENYDWYRSGMKRVIRHLQRNLPTADILVVSVGDRSYKEDMDFVTQPNIPVLVEAQRKAAKETGVAFWNLYQAMGGYNAMVKWVEAEKPLANKDYTHVNYRGARKIAKMLKNHLLREYNQYIKKANLEE